MSAFRLSHGIYTSLANLRHDIDSNLKNLGEKDLFFFAYDTGSGLFGTPLHTLHFPFPVFCFKVEIFTSTPQFDNIAGLEWLAWFAWNLWERMDLVSLIWFDWVGGLLAGFKWLADLNGWMWRMDWIWGVFSFELHAGEIDDLIWLIRSGHLSAQKLLRDSLGRIRWLISLISF